MAFHETKRRIKSLVGIFLQGNLTDKIRLLWQVFVKNIRELRVKLFIKQLHGPKVLSLKSNEVAVLCLYRDGMSYLPYFLNYHRKLGVAHFVFIDNGSKDQSMEFIKAQPDTTLYHSRLSFRDYKLSFKNFLCESYGKMNWGLLLDIDEFFDFPNSDRISLSKFISYLEETDATAVLANMLDLFSEHPILDKLEEGEDLSATYKFYDLTQLNKEDYALLFGRTNQLDNHKICTFRGGVRMRFFKDESVLTKHPLFRLQPGMACTSNGHDIRFAKVADTTAILYHYKFNRDYQMVAQRALVEKGYYAGVGGYKIADEELAKNPRLKLFTENSKELKSTNQLLEQDFILISQRFQNWTEQAESRENG
jgi:hypothetical protein